MIFLCTVFYVGLWIQSDQIGRGGSRPDPHCSCMGHFFSFPWPAAGPGLWGEASPDPQKVIAGWGNCEIPRPWFCRILHTNNNTVIIFKNKNKFLNYIGSSVFFFFLILPLLSEIPNSCLFHYLFGELTNHLIFDVQLSCIFTLQTVEGSWVDSACVSYSSWKWHLDVRCQTICLISGLPPCRWK